MPYVVVGLIILFIFWDELFYAIGGILGLAAIFFIFNVVFEYTENKLSDEEWMAKYPDEERRPSRAKQYAILALIFGGLSYLAIDYQTSTWHNPELIAQEEAAKKAEEERLAAERQAQYAAERNEKNLQRISEFDAEEKNLFDTKFQEYQNAGNSEIDARTKAVDDVNKFASDKATEKLRAELAEKNARAEAEKAEQERIAAEKKLIAEKKSAAESTPETVASGRINIDSLANVNSNVLANQVIEYINANPDKIFTLKNYLVRLNTVTNKRESDFENRSKDGEAMALNIPIIGGIILDDSYEKFVDSYKNAIVRAIDDNSALEKSFDYYHNNGQISDVAYNELCKKYLVDKNDVENYNALVKIAAIKYHAVEAYVEGHKTRVNFLSPDIFDIIDAASYAAFSSKDDREKYQSSKNAVNKICAELDMDLKNYSTKEKISEYYNSLIPKYIFAFELEEIYVPANKNSVYLENSAKGEQRKRIYNLMAGEWTSLVTGKIHNITDLSANDNSPRTPRINYVETLDKNEPLARFNFLTGNGSNVKIFITPANYIKNGQKSKVLVLYFEYELIGGNETTIYKNGRVTNIRRAEDVYIKKI